MHKNRLFYPALLSAGFGILATFNSLTGAQAATATLPPPTPVKYEMKTFTIPGNTFLAPFGPNAEGTVAGFYYDSDGNSHGFVLRDGTVTTVDAPGWDQTAITGINDWGTVSVTAFNDTDTAGVDLLHNLWDGSWFDLPAIPNMDVGNDNVAINDLGVVTGYGTYTDGTTVAWTWDGRSYSFFSAPGADETLGGTQPFSINNRGQIAGNYVDSSGVTHGFIKDGPNFTTVDVPGTISTGPISINDEGDIVGTYYFDFTSSLPYAGQQGFILHAGTLYTFPVPGYGGITAINDLGVLSGTYIVDPAVENIWTGFVAVPKF